MSGRLTLLFAFLIVVNVAVVSTMTSVLPGSLTNGLGAIGVGLTQDRSNTEEQSAGTGSSVDQPARPLSGRLLSEYWLLNPRQLPQPVRMYLRPFGLHQRGVAGLSLYALSFAVLASTSILIVLIIPEHVRVLRDAMSQDWRQGLRLGVIGLTAYLGALLLAFALTFLFVGIPFALIFALALAALSVVGVVAIIVNVGYRLARRVGEARPRAVVQLMVGLLVVFPLSILPYVGWICLAVVACLGLGAIIYTRFGTGTVWTLEALE